MRILVTGAAGFLGSHAVEHFLENTEFEVVGLVSLRHRGEADRLVHLLNNPRFNVVYHDLRAPITPYVAAEIGPVDYIVNYASESHVDRSIDEPVDFIRNNVDVVLHMLEYARQHGAHLRAFVQISTDEVYGPAPIGHAHSEWEPHYPSNPYSASKSAQESIAFSYWRTYGVPVVITNCMNLIGERQDGEKFLPMLISKIARGTRPVPIHGQQRNGHWVAGSRFYLHARNLADAVLHLITLQAPTRFSPGHRPDKFHIAGEREITNLELAHMVAAELGKPLRYEWQDFHTSRPGHDMRYALDSDKIAHSGWRAPISFEESLRRTIKWTVERGGGWL